MQNMQDRREFLKAAGIGVGAFLAAGCSAGRMSGAKSSDKKGAALKLGMASYTCREFNLDETIAMTKRVGFEYICLKDFHLPLDSTPEKIAQAAEKVKAAGLKLYAGGVIYMKNEAEVNRAFEYARLAGMKTIVGVPNHELLPLVAEKARQYDIAVAIHNHGPGDKLYPTPESVFEKIRDTDSRIGLCIDVGHTARAGVDPAEAAKRFGYRLLDVHIKDVSAMTREGNTVEIGRGVVDIPKFIPTLLEINYKGITAFEYEKDAKDPLPGLAESVGYVKGVLATV
jgi:sugar phosphate isomerase/epimerase